jgi:hypothetical protein
MHAKNERAITMMLLQEGLSSREASRCTLYLRSLVAFRVLSQMEYFELVDGYFVSFLVPSAY